MSSTKYTYIRKTFTFNGQRYEVKGKTEAEAITKMVRLQEELAEAKAAEARKVQHLMDQIAFTRA